MIIILRPVSWRALLTERTVYNRSEMNPIFVSWRIKDCAFGWSEDEFPLGAISDIPPAWIDMRHGVQAPTNNKIKTCS